MVPRRLPRRAGCPGRGSGRFVGRRWGGRRPRPDVSTYATGATVPYRLVKTGRGPSEIAERLGVRACPTCGADWTEPGSHRVGHSGGREYLCWGCMTFHPGQLVDLDGHPLPSPGWGLARAQNDDRLP